MKKNRFVIGLCVFCTSLAAATGIVTYTCCKSNKESITFGETTENGKTKYILDNDVAFEKLPDDFDADDHDIYLTGEYGGLFRFNGCKNYDGKLCEMGAAGYIESLTSLDNLDLYVSYNSATYSSYLYYSVKMNESDDWSTPKVLANGSLVENIGGNYFRLYSTIGGMYINSAYYCFTCEGTRSSSEVLTSAYHIESSAWKRTTLTEDQIKDTKSGTWEHVVGLTAEETEDGEENYSASIFNAGDWVKAASTTMETNRAGWIDYNTNSVQVLYTNVTGRDNVYEGHFCIAFYVGAPIICNIGLRCWYTGSTTVWLDNNTYFYGMMNVDGEALGSSNQSTSLVQNVETDVYFGNNKMRLSKGWHTFTFQRFNYSDASRESFYIRGLLVQPVKIISSDGDTILSNLTESNSVTANLKTFTMGWGINSSNSSWLAVSGSSHTNSMLRKFTQSGSTHTVLAAVGFGTEYIIPIGIENVGTKTSLNISISCTGNSSQATNFWNCYQVYIGKYPDNHYDIRHNLNTLKQITGCSGGDITSGQDTLRTVSCGSISLSSYGLSSAGNYIIRLARATLKTSSAADFDLDSVTLSLS